MAWDEACQAPPTKSLVTRRVAITRLHCIERLFDAVAGCSRSRRSRKCRVSCRRAGGPVRADRPPAALPRRAPVRSVSSGRRHGAGYCGPGPSATSSSERRSVPVRHSVSSGWCCVVTHGGCPFRSRPAVGSFAQTSPPTGVRVSTGLTYARRRLALWRTSCVGKERSCEASDSYARVSTFRSCHHLVIVVKRSTSVGSVSCCASASAHCGRCRRRST